MIAVIITIILSVMGKVSKVWQTFRRHFTVKKKKVL